MRRSNLSLIVVMLGGVISLVAVMMLSDPSVMKKLIVLPKFWSVFGAGITALAFLPLGIEIYQRVGMEAMGEKSPDESRATIVFSIIWIILGFAITFCSRIIATYMSRIV